MKCEWNEILLESVITDIAAGPFGSRLKVSSFVQSGFPIIDGANLKGFKVTDNITKFVTEEKARSLSRSIAKRNDIVITISGTLGQIAYVPWTSRYPEYLCSQRQFRVTFDTQKVCVPYLVYYFHTHEGQNKILSFANQTGVPALAQPLKNFRKIRVNLPDIETQERIVSVLSSLDDKIELNNKINANLEQQAQALYRFYFPYDVTSELPNGWRVGTVGEIACFHDFKRIPLSGSERGKMKEKRYPYYGAASLMDYVDDYIFDGRYLLLGEDGTVVNSVGLPVLQYVWGKFWVNNHAHVLTGELGFSVESLYMLFKQTSVQSIVTGAVQPKISQAGLRSVEVVIPPESLLSSFNIHVDPLFKLIRDNVSENICLAKIRDFLLPKLMSGEIQEA